MTKPKGIKIQKFKVEDHEKPAKYFILKHKKYWKTDEGWYLKAEITDMGKFSDDDFYSVRCGC